MAAWLIWIVVAVALTIAEVFSLDLVLIMFAAGAFAAAGAAGLGASPLIQAIVFALVSVIALLGIRPLAKRHLDNTASHVRHGVDALKGATATVLTRVDENSGLVKIGGEEWTARSFDATQVHEPGDTVEVIDIKGATAMVWRQP